MSIVLFLFIIYCVFSQHVELVTIFASSLFSVKCVLLNLVSLDTLLEGFKFMDFSPLCAFFVRLIKKERADLIAFIFLIVV